MGIGVFPVIIEGRNQFRETDKTPLFTMIVPQI